MSHVDTGYTLSSTTKLGFTEAVARVRAELASEGFGVLGCAQVWVLVGPVAEQMLSIVGNDALSETASEVRRRLASVVERAASA